ncbi:MAG: hypothetical protein JWP75_4049 [Frondihabitans sp.]|nr:hypothetical protein [Frondihabitans sp.]
MTVHVFGTMGTVVSLRSSDGALSGDDLEAVEAVFRSYDQMFSLYDDDSALSRIRQGELTLAGAETSVRDAYSVAIDWRNRTAGAFTPHRPDGVIDLSGVVKALAMADAALRLDDRADAWLLNVGGDVLARGSHEGSPWSVGVVDPSLRDRLAGLVELTGTRCAVATSGTAERGQHIWRRGSEAFTQVTVIADDIVTADVIATAIAAGDEEDLDRLTAAHDIDVLTFDATGAARATPGARRWVV